MKTFLLDLDGTMYHGKAIIPEAKAFIDICNKQGYPYYFLTNNATRTKKANVLHMEEMGYTGIKEESFFTSAMAAASYVSKHSKSKKAYYLGMDGLKEALLQEGFIIDDRDVDYVFVGLDTLADYEKYSKALGLLLKGAKLIGTNSDRVIATENGYKIGNGSIVTMLEYASGQTSPKIGKPNAIILDEFLTKYQLSKDEVVMVGDNLETDILLGVNNQIETILVTSGVHQKDDIKRLSIKPDQVISSLMELL